MAPQRGFTLVEVVVAITIASIVVAFAALFIAAPVNAYDSEQRRAAIVDEAGAAWPAIEADLKHALPNSLRARRNGANVVLEMLRAEQYSRYIGNPSSASFNVAAPLGTAGNYNMYLSVNNCGAVPPACPDAYTRTVSMTSQRTITITDLALGEQKIDVSAPAPVFGLDSPRRTIYLVSGPVTYLCNETQGTLRRYDRY